MLLKCTVLIACFYLGLLTAGGDCQWEWWESALLVAVVTGVMGILTEVIKARLDREEDK